MKFRHRTTTFLFALMAVTGCASTKVAEQTPMVAPGSGSRKSRVSYWCRDSHTTDSLARSNIRPRDSGGQAALPS